MNRVALITGASRGIGRGIALELAGLGYDLALGYRADDAAMRTAAADCLAAGKARDVRVEPMRGDIADQSTRQELIEKVRAAFGRLDLLVNNAGVAPRQRVDLLSTTEASFDE